MIVPTSSEFVRVDQFLAAQEGIVSRGIAQRLIREGLVNLGGKKVKKPSDKLKPGTILTYRLPEVEPVQLMPRPFPLEILYEDKLIIVVNKPPNMVIHPAPGHEDDTLVNALLAHTRALAPMGGARRPGIVHRLDKGTSGALIVAKTDKAYLSLTKQFRERLVEKTYHALVYGQMDRDEGVIEHAISRSARNRKKMAVTRTPKSGREAVTRWKVKASFTGLSFLELHPKTGRTHQLRVHLNSIGHPILGDPVYGRRRFPKTGILAPLAKEIRALRRQALHASEITFLHPATQKRLSIKAPCALDLQHLYNLMVDYFNRKD